MFILIESKETVFDCASAHVWASLSKWAEDKQVGPETADQASRGEDKEDLFIKIKT